MALDSIEFLPRHLLQFSKPNAVRRDLHVPLGPRPSLQPLVVHHEPISPDSCKKTLASNDLVLALGMHGARAPHGLVHGSSDRLLNVFSAQLAARQNPRGKNRALDNPLDFLPDPSLGHTKDTLKPYLCVRAGSGLEDSVSKYHSIASWVLASVSFWVSLWLRPPDSLGTFTQYPLLFSLCKTTVQPNNFFRIAMIS